MLLVLETDQTMAGRLLVILLVNMVIRTEALFPFLEPCPRDLGPAFDACVLRSIRGVYPHFMDAHPEYNTSSMDPLHVDKLVIEQGTELLGYTIETTNVTLHGLKDAFIRNVKVDLDDGWVFYDVLIPQLNMTSNYFLSGRILILYVNGSGDDYMTLNDVNTVVKVNFTKYRALGLEGVEHEYYNITKLKVKLNIGKAKMQFNNLFNGNKVLENNANQFLSRNWRELFRFLGPAIDRSLSENVIKQLNNLKMHLPLDESFPLSSQGNIAVTSGK